MNKDRVAEILAEIGTLLELKGENPFKTRAYENAARTLESLSEPLEKLIAEDKLGVKTIEQLEMVCKACKAAALDGFGEKTQSKILEGIEFKRTYASRHLLS